jgi:hypothetical protein
MAARDAGYAEFRNKFTRRGGLTTFNILFKNKNDQFRTSVKDGSIA